MDRTDARTELDEAGREAVELARRWVAESADQPIEYAARLLSRVLKDPKGLEFTVRFVDGVIRPQDLGVAARTLARLARRDTSFLPPYLAAGVKAAGPAAVAAPEVVVPAARRVFRQLVGDLIVNTTGEGLATALAQARADGNRVNVNLLGEAVLGDGEAARRLAANARLLARDDVDYLSLKVSAVTGPHNPWGFDEVVEHAVEHLLPFYLDAASASTPKFVNLDMEDYKDLALTLTVFRRLLDYPALLHHEAGIVLQAYQPDALAAMMELQEWAARRVEAGGARIKVRLVKGANLAMERVDAELHDWPLTTWPTKLETDTNYKRVMDWSLTPERTRNIHLGIAGQNIFDIALAWVLGGQRGVRDDVEIEMLAGMATGLAEVVRREVGHLLLYVPVVDPKEFDVAIAYLVRRLEENSLPENFMSGVFDIAGDSAVFARERDRFLASLAAVDDAVPTPRRTQDRATETAEEIAAVVQDGEGNWRFHNTPDTDPILPGNRAWARAIVSRIPGSRLGVAEADAAIVPDTDAIDRLLEATADAGAAWGARPAAERAEILHRAGVELGLRRAELLEVAASEAGKTLDQGDPEVSEAIDFCHWYASLAPELERVAGARFVPSRVTLVTPPWNFPVAIPTGGVLAALAAGSAVVFKPATPARRSGAVLAEALWAAGVPREVLRLVQTPDRAVGRHLVSHPLVDRVILTGSYETAKLFRSWRHDLPLLAETSGKNSIIVTPSADPDLAVKDVVYSAFGHAGQKCSAGSLVILVGSMATSRRFHDQLVDAVRSLHVAWPADPSSQMGPVVVPGDEKLRRGLTALGDGEHWVLKPRALDETGALWSPGVRAGVRPGSEYHLTEYFGPILGVMTAETLEEAIEIQNAVDYGLTAGLQSLDPRELEQWLAGVQAGNLYVNRVITGAIVRRQPFGGWKRSAVGAGSKAGGPNYLFGLGTWEPVPADEAEAMPTEAALPVDTEAALPVAPTPPDAPDIMPPSFAASPGDATGGPSPADVVESRASTPADAPDIMPPSFAATPVDDLPGPVRDVVEAAGGVLEPAEYASLRRAVASDAAAWASEFGVTHDPTGLRVERNILRYLPTPVTVRVDEGEKLVDLVRVVAAGVRAGAELTLSTGVRVPGVVTQKMVAVGVTVRHESNDDWHVAATAWAKAEPLGARVRLVGPGALPLARAIEGLPDIAIYSWPVTEAGRVELLPFVHEQSVSITAHRFGTPFKLSEGVI